MRILDKNDSPIVNGGNRLQMNIIDRIKPLGTISEKFIQIIDTIGLHPEEKELLLEDLAFLSDEERINWLFDLMLGVNMIYRHNNYQKSKVV